MLGKNFSSYLGLPLSGTNTMEQQLFTTNDSNLSGEVPVLVDSLATLSIDNSLTESVRRVLPNREQVRELDQLAWLGDSLLQSDLRYTVIARTGNIDDVWVSKVSSGEYMLAYLREHTDYILPENISAHTAGQAFEYLYYTDNMFRMKFRKAHDMEQFSYKSPLAVVAPAQTEDPSRCWRVLYKEPFVTHQGWAKHQFLSAKQLIELTRTNQLAEGKFDVHRNFDTKKMHVVRGSTYSASQVIACMTKKDRIGGLTKYQYHQEAQIDHKLSKLRRKPMYKKVRTDKCYECKNEGWVNVRKSNGCMKLYSYLDQLWCKTCMNRDKDIRNDSTLYCVDCKYCDYPMCYDGSICKANESDEISKAFVYHPRNSELGFICACMFCEKGKAFPGCTEDEYRKSFIQNVKPLVEQTTILPNLPIFSVRYKGQHTVSSPQVKKIRFLNDDEPEYLHVPKDQITENSFGQRLSALVPFELDAKFACPELEFSDEENDCGSSESDEIRSVAFTNESEQITAILEGTRASSPFEKIMAAINVEGPSEFDKWQKIDIQVLFNTTDAWRHYSIDSLFDAKRVETYETDYLQKRCRYWDALKVASSKELKAETENYLVRRARYWDALRQPIVTKPRFRASTRRQAIKIDNGYCFVRLFKKKYENVAKNVLGMSPKAYIVQSLPSYMYSTQPKVRLTLSRNGFHVHAHNTPMDINLLKRRLRQLPHAPVGILPWFHDTIPQPELTIKTREETVACMKDRELRHLKKIMDSGQFQQCWRLYKWSNVLMNGRYTESKAWVVAENEFWDVVWHPSTLTLWSKNVVPYQDQTLPFDYSTSPLACRSIPYHDHRWVEHGGHIAKKAGEYITPEDIMAHKRWAAGMSKYKGRPKCGHEGEGYHYKGKQLCYACGIAAVETLDWREFFPAWSALKEIGDYETLVGLFNETKPAKSEVWDEKDDDIWFHDIEMKSSHAYLQKSYIPSRSRLSFCIRLRRSSHLSYRVRFPFNVWASPNQLSLSSMAGYCFYTDKRKGTVIFPAFSEITTEKFTKGSPFETLTGLKIAETTMKTYSNAMPESTCWSMARDDRMVWEKGHVDWWDKFSFYTFAIFDPATEQSIDPIVYESAQLLATRLRFVSGNGYQRKQVIELKSQHSVVLIRPRALPFTGTSIEYARYLASFAAKPRHGKDVVTMKSSNEFGAPPLWRGLPYFKMGENRDSPDNCYRGDEQSLYRKPAFRGLYNTAFPAGMRRADNELISRVTSVVDMIKRIAKGRKIMITAAPDGPPPHAGIGFVPIAFNTKRKDWFHIPISTISGNDREWAFWRLAAIYTGLDVWIVNGRLVESHREPKPDSNRIASINNGTATPLLLSSSRITPEFVPPPLREFATWLQYASTYGADEVFLMNCPLTGYFPRKITRDKCWALPQDYAYKDAKIYEEGTLTYQGEWSRVTVAKHLANQIEPPSNLKKALSITEQKRIDTLWANKKPLKYITNPLDDIPDKHKMLLIVTFGTRGDVEPVEALAQLIQAMGVEVRVWKARDVSSLELFNLDDGSIAHLIPAFMRMWAAGGTGWKCVMLPHTPTFGPHILYDMTPWKEMRSYKAPKTFLGQASARLAELKGAHLTIGASKGCNTIAFQNSKPIKFIDEKKLRTKKYIVLGSGGINEAEHEYLENPEWEIHDNPHHYDGFQDALEVRCAGGQGIMRVLQANNVPTVHVAWPSKDRDYKYDCNKGNTFEMHGIVALEDQLCHHGFLKPKTPFQKWAATVRYATWPYLLAALLSSLWMWYIKAPTGLIYVAWAIWLGFATIVLGVATFDPYVRHGVLKGITDPFDMPWYEWLRYYLFIQTMFPVIFHFSFYLASFPELLTLKHTWLALIPGVVMKTLLRWPILMQYGGIWSVILFYFMFWTARQYALTYLAADRQTYLRIRFNKGWPPMRHVLFTDKRLNETVEMRWLGNPNLKTPFEGVVVKNDHHRGPLEWWVPVPINYAKIKRKTLASAGQYGPNFNCQTEAMRVSQDPTTIILIGMHQLLVYPAISIAYTIWKLMVYANPVLGDRPVDSFFRFATEQEYAETEDLLALREKEREDWRKELFGEHEVKEKLEQASKIKAIIITQPDGSDKILTDKNDIATHMPSEYDKAQMEETDELDSHQQTVNFIADLVKRQIDDGVVEEEAYHLGVRALRKAILAYKQPEEVLTWVEKYSPKIQTHFSEVTQLLGDFLRYHVGKDCVAFGAVQTLYQWIEGIGSKAKTMTIRLWEAFDYVATIIAMTSHTAWIMFSLVGRAFMDWAFRGKLNLRFKSVWALGGVARNPKMAAQKRMLESIAYHRYVRKGFFEDEYKKICDNLSSLLPDKSLPADSNERNFLSPQEGGSKNKPFEILKAPSQTQLGGHQYRSVGIPRKPVVTEQEAQVLRDLGWDKRLLVDAERSQQTAKMLERGVKQCLDGAYKVAINPNVMADMSARYAYYGLELDPSKEMIPPVLSDIQAAEADSVARAMSEAYPESFKDMKYTHEHAMMRYYEWQRRIGSPFERHYRLRWEAWRAGVGYQVLADVVRERTTGDVAKAQYGSFVKSQEVPWDKKPRGVTFMNIERWFKGQCEQFERNSRVVWKTRGSGKNMPLNQNMADIFRQVNAMEIKFEGDNREADSRFEAYAQEVVARLAFYGWNDERLASISRAYAEAQMDSWIFNLHMNKGDHVPTWMKPAMHHPNAAKFSNVSEKRRGGATGDFHTSQVNTDVILGSYCGAIVSWLQSKGIAISHDDFFAKEEIETSVKATIPSHEVLDDGLPYKEVKRKLLVSKYIQFNNTGDDNICGINLKRIIKDFAPYLEGVQFVADDFAKWCGDHYNMDVTIIEHNEQNGRWNEYLSKYMRPATIRDRHVVNRVEAIYREKGIFGPDDRILDPTTNLPVSEIIYQNLLSPMSKQTALKAYKEQAFRDRYLLSLIERDAGHMALCAFVPDFYMQCSSTMHHNLVRYLAAAAFPRTCRDSQGLPISPQGKEREFIERHIKVLFEDVGQRMPYFLIDGNLRRDKSIDHIPAEFVDRLKIVKKLYIPRYSKVVHDHFVVAHKTPAYHDRLMAKLNKGIYGYDEGAKMLLDSARSWIEAFPRKLSRGVVATLEMVYPDEIWNGTGRVEAFVMLSEELVTAPGQIIGADAFQRRVNQSPYAGCCNAPKFYWQFSTPEGRAKLHEHPRYIYQNACVWISIIYAFMWYVERWILSLPFLGLAWALMMFYMIDITKFYAVAGLVFWHHAGAASLVISGLMPRDIYIWSKRFADWLSGFIPLELGYITRFDIPLQYAATTSEWMAEFLQHATYLTPQTSSGVGTFQNEWEPVANETMLRLYEMPVKALSIKGPTGTGKSSFFIYALMRMNDLERGGDLWLIAPTEVLRDDWSLPDFFAIGNHTNKLSERNSQFQVLKKGVEKRPNARIFLATYGHFVQRILAGHVREKDIVCFDESHTGSGAMVHADQLLKEKGIWIVYLSATPAPVKGIDFGPTIDSSYAVQKKWKAKTVVFPAATNVVAMYQQARLETKPDPMLGHSHRTLSTRTIISVPTLKAVTETIAGIEELRKADATIPPTVEFTSVTAKHNKAQREKVLATGSFVMVCTEGIMRAGYDVKPAAYMVIDSGLGVQQHEGQLLPPSPTTQTMMEQLHGRTGRNSSDRHGLIYCTDVAGTGETALTYPNGSLFAEKSVAHAFTFPQLKELPFQGAEKWNYFDIRTDVAYDPVIKDALRFVFLAAMSGVMPRDMKSFYAWHAQEGRTLPDHHEWMAQNLHKHSFMRYPAWDLVLAAMETNPFIVNTKKVIGGKRAIDNLVYSSVIYPIARNWTPYSIVAGYQRSTVFRGSLTDEAAAYEELVARLKDQIARLKSKMARSFTARPGLLGLSKIEEEATRKSLERAQEHLETVRTHKAAVDNVARSKEEDLAHDIHERLANDGLQIMDASVHNEKTKRMLRRLKDKAKVNRRNAIRERMGLDPTAPAFDPNSINEYVDADPTEAFLFQAQQTPAFQQAQAENRQWTCQINVKTGLYRLTFS